MTEKKHLDREGILICGLIAVLASVSVIFMVFTYFEWDITSCDPTKLVTWFFVLAGSIWGILLCRNC